MIDDGRSTPLSWEAWIEQATAKYSRLTELARERGDADRVHYFEGFVAHLTGQRDDKAVTMSP